MSMEIQDRWLRAACIVAVVGCSSCVFVPDAPRGRGASRAAVVVSPNRASGGPGQDPRAEVPQLQPPPVMHWCAAHCFTWVWRQDRYCRQGGDCQTGWMAVESFSPDAIVMRRTDDIRSQRWARLTGRLASDGNSIVDGVIHWSDGANLSFKAVWGPALNELPGSDAEAQAWAQRAAEPAKPAQKRSPEDVGKTIPKDDVTNAAIDDGFKRWSSGWMVDRYVPGSARTTDRGFRDGAYIVRGLFDFVRGGVRLTIPFAAAFTDSTGHYHLSNLCYNDNTSGMTDCIDPSDARSLQRSAVQSRQFLGAIVLLGLVAAMSTSTEICERHTTVFGDYLDCY